MFPNYFKSCEYKRSLKGFMYVCSFRILQDIMQNDSGIILKISVVFQINLRVKNVSNYWRRIHERILKSPVGIKLQIFNVCEALCYKHHKIVL